MSRFVLGVAVWFLAAAPSFAQAAPDARTQEAAMTLLESMHMDRVLSDAIKQTLDLQIQQNPQIAPMRGVMDQFFAKYMSWNALKDDMAAMYAREFSEAELTQITAFYQSPVGQKMVDKMPSMMSQGMALGQQRVQAHMTELQAALMAEMAKQGKAP